MDFYIETGDLQQAIKLLSVTAKMNAKDSTGKILIIAGEDGVVTFLSNNGATALSYHSEKVDIQVPGTTVIEYGKVKSFVSSFHPWDEQSGVKGFHFSLTEKSLTINVDNVYEDGKTSKGNLRLRIYDPTTVRPPSNFRKPNFMLNSTIFRTATSKVLYAIDPSETRSFLQGMNIVFSEDEICFVGTDGQRLSEYKIKNISELDSGMFLLRYDFVMGLRRAISDNAQIAFEFTKTEVKAEFGNVNLWGRNIIGHQFPDYKHHLTSFEHTITLDKDVLMSVLLPFADILDPDDNHRLSFSLNNGDMKLFSDMAEFQYDGKVDFSGEFVMDVQGPHMIQTIDVIQDDKILVRFSDPMKPLIFDSGNFEDQNALIMPLRRR